MPSRAALSSTTATTSTSRPTTWCTHADDGGPTPDTNSASWFIPSDAEVWRWTISQMDTALLAAPQSLVTSIPDAARTTGAITVADEPIETVLTNELGVTEPLSYQTFTYADRQLWGCDWNGATWFGLLNVQQGHAEMPTPPVNVGIGGHCDQCMLNQHATDPDAYTWPDDDIEVWWGQVKDPKGMGGNGTACVPDERLPGYRFEIWAR